MARYSKGVLNVQLKGKSGTWKAVEQHELGFLIWKSELFGDNARRVLTDIEGNVIMSGVNSFMDVRVRALVSRYERERNQPVIYREMADESLPDDTMGRKASDSKIGELSGEEDNKEEEIRRPERKKAATGDPGKRESVLSKLHEYQEYVDKRNLAEKK